MNTLFTIGHSNRLRKSGVRRVVDVRLNNVSQLAGFSKRDDLKFFLNQIGGIDYVHVPLLAPTSEMLDEYRKTKTGWDVYAGKFNRLLEERRIQREISKELVRGGCLLCSEDKPHHCHRRLVAEYLQKHWGKLEIVHL